MLGVDGFGEPSLAQLDGAHKCPGSFGCSVGEREVRVLVTVTDQLAQAQRTKTVLGDDAVPDVGLLGAETTRLATEIAAAVTRVTGVPSERVLVVFQSSPASFAIDGARVLPEPGEEAAWIAGS